MKAAVVSVVGQPPVYGEFPDPVAAGECVVVEVAACAFTHLTRGRASGTHYSSGGRLPFVPGVDGTGWLADGRRVCFLLPEAPYGGMGERTLVPASRCLALPDGLDLVKAAALANPGMSSWAALQERARFLPGETVLINGGTGTAGRLAIQIAKHLGAKRVIATGRNPATLALLAALGADATISLRQDRGGLDRDFQAHFAEGVDVVLDYLWGESAETLLMAAAKAAPEAVPIRFVQIGSVSSPTIGLPATALRSSPLTLMGSGLSSVPLPRLVAAVDAVLHAAVPGGFEIAIERVALADVAAHWSEVEGTARTVFVSEKGAAAG